jgi:hypothetical protein
MDMGIAALNIVGFVAAGAMGWFGTAFLGRPIRHFFDLRGEVIRRWTQCANVRARWKEDPSKTWQTVEEPGFTEADAKRLEEAEGIFRELGSQMRAFAQNETLAVWIVKLLRYDPVMASAGLIGMSHSLATYGHNRVLQKRGFKTRCVSANYPSLVGRASTRCLARRIGGAGASRARPA